MYVANVVDTGLFRAVGKPPNETYRNLRTAVRDADTTLHLPETIYRELGGDPTTETRAVVPEYGYYDIETNLYPPRTVQSAFPDAENFR